MMRSVSGVQGACSEMMSASSKTVWASYIFTAALLVHSVIWVRVESQHTHAESLEDLRGDSPDLSGADDPDGLAVEVESHQAVEREVELVDPVEGAVSFPDPA